MPNLSTSIKVNQGQPAVFLQNNSIVVEFRLKHVDSFVNDSMFWLRIFPPKYRNFAQSFHLVNVVNVELLYLWNVAREIELIWASLYKDLRRIFYFQFKI